MSVDFGMLARMIVDDFSKKKKEQFENEKEVRKSRVMRVLTGVFIYIVTFLLVLYLRKDEFYVFMSMFSGLVLVSLLTTVEALVSSIAVGIWMTIISYICVRYFKMWKHNFTRWVIPYWMPVAWSLVGVLVTFIISLLTS